MTVESVVMTVGSVALVGVTGLLGVAIGAEGVKKLAGAHVDDFRRYGYPQWFRVLVGSLEALGGAGLLLGALVNGTFALAAGILVAVVLLGALVTHVRVGDSVSDMVPAAVVLVLALVVVATHAELVGYG